MQSTRDDNRSYAQHRLTDYPALAALRLNEHDLDELACQGFVCGERRGNRLLFKLRFRRQRRQVVRYVGSARKAAAVRGELAELQAAVKAKRELNQVTRFACKALREAKVDLKPILESHGFKFHGMSIRRPRQPTIPSAPPDPERLRRDP